MRPLILALAIGTTALVAGLLYGFTVAVNPALARLPAPDYIRAMQAINDAILNPLFALSFFGAPVLLPLAAGLYARRPLARRRFRLLTLAAVLYLVGCLGVTVAVNVPLNEQLARFPVHTATAAQAEATRTAYAESWNRWHNVRTLASLAALGLAIGAGLTRAPEAG